MNALHPECGLCVFDPNVCVLYFETRAFYHANTYLIKLQAIKKRWKNGFDEIFMKLDFISSQWHVPPFSMTPKDFNITKLENFQLDYTFKS